jgi:hypothetical protein
MMPGSSIGYGVQIRLTNSRVVARFFGIAKPILDGDVVLVTGTEISAKA